MPIAAGGKQHVFGVLKQVFAQLPPDEVRGIGAFRRARW
jgi:hypothetical protein